MRNGSLVFLAQSNLSVEVESVDAFFPQLVAYGGSTFAEIRKGSTLFGIPTNFCQCQSAGIEHVFGVLNGGDVFRPKVSLHTANRFARLCIQFFHRHKAIDLFERQVSTNRFGLEGRRILIIIKVTVSSGCENHLEVALSCLTRQFRRAPVHNVCARFKRVCHHLVPTNECATMRCQEGIHVTDEVALKCVDMLQTQLFRFALTERAILPCGFSCLISAYVDVR